MSDDAKPKCGCSVYGGWREDCPVCGADPKPELKRAEPNGPWKPDYKVPKGTAARHAEAYRAHAGIVGRLLTCICTWPLDEDSATISQHSEFCPVELAAKRADLAKRDEIARAMPKTGTP